MEHSWLLWSTSSMCRYQKNGSASKEGQQRTLQTLELDRDRTTNGLFNGLYSCMQSILPSMGLWRASLFNYMIRTAIGIGYCWRIATVTQMYQSMFRSRVMELATSTGAEVQTAEGTLSIRVCVCVTNWGNPFHPSLPRVQTSLLRSPISAQVNGSPT